MKSEGVKGSQSKQVSPKANIYSLVQSTYWLSRPNTVARQAVGGLLGLASLPSQAK